jgi:hypothetical protein
MQPNVVRLVARVNHLSRSQANEIDVAANDCAGCGRYSRTHRVRLSHEQVCLDEAEMGQPAAWIGAKRRRESSGNPGLQNVNIL